MALSPEVKDAANHIQSHADGLRAIITLAEFVADTTALEQLAAETESRRASAASDLEAVTAELTKAKASVDRAKDAAKAAEADVKVEVEKLIAKAKDDAAAIETKANASATRIISDANATAAQAKVVADGEVQAAKAALSLVNADIAAAKDTLAETEAQTQALIAKADEARAYLAKLAGG